jgi:hypothetical protein
VGKELSSILRPNCSSQEKATHLNIKERKYDGRDACRWMLNSLTQLL